ncbi:preprotein translocase subunit SecD family protein [Halorubrum vacuolatum]|uniref:Uncharacterized protein n=1 Tax=Halorubrum vacuolatum TaxID=63740 RepID=A0A238VTU8_HALVU|nr:hypothetical protein [Halorubrum vacuolatum]SNR37577.1 hypothetical protein SAMN06264855_10455 [Halorubrum vacuolatum]
MELSRRGALGGLAAIGAVGAVGFMGASAVDDPATDEDETDAHYVEVDPETPFIARLVDDDGDRELFTAADLVHVQGVHPDDEEYLVFIELTETGRERFQDELAAAGAEADPDGFEIVMTLDGAVVREVSLDGPTVDALTDEEWEGVVTLPFVDEDLAEDVYEALAGM